MIPTKRLALADADEFVGLDTLDAVLFDMDGTLTDTEGVWCSAFTQVAGELGGVLTDGGRGRLLGQSLRRSVEILHEHIEVDADVDDSVARLTEVVADIYRSGVPLRDGARELIAQARAEGLRTALVTSSPRALVELALGTLGAENFAAVVTGDDVVNPKPNPEPYLRAMKLLGVSANQCIVIEDSPTGATAAEAAGLPVVVVPSSGSVPVYPTRTILETLADVSVRTLAEIRADREVRVAFGIPTRSGSRWP